MTITTTTGRVRRLAVGMLMGLAVALALLGTGARDAGATSDQSQFVKDCKTHGGTPQSIGAGSVRCSYPSGIKTSCHFTHGVGNPDACVDYIPPFKPRTTGGAMTPGGQGPSNTAVSSATTEPSSTAADAPPTDAGTDGSMIPLE